jgi:hypothetical protein
MPMYEPKPLWVIFGTDGDAHVGFRCHPACAEAAAGPDVDYVNPYVLADEGKKADRAREKA